MFSRCVQRNAAVCNVKRASLSARSRNGVLQTRLISSYDMFEAFGTAPSATSGKPKGKTTTAKGSGAAAAPAATTGSGMDPVINISRDFSSSTKYNSPVNKSEVTSIGDVFTKSLNDFSGQKETQPRDDASQNWAASFHGLGNEPFSKEAQDTLYAELAEDDIEITPDGLLYLPEIKYRRILNRAFGAGAWGLAPRSETLVQMQDMGGLLTREYGLVIHGRLVSIARGEQTFFKEQGIPTATEGCKSNALMRCCKDLGIASELWDPRFIKKFKKSNCENIFVEYIPTKKKKKIWKRKDEDVEYPFKR